MSAYCQQLRIGWQKVGGGGAGKKLYILTQMRSRSPFKTLDQWRSLPSTFFVPAESHSYVLKSIDGSRMGDQLNV